MCRHGINWKQRGHLGEESPNPGSYFGHTPEDTLGEMRKNVKERAASLIDREGKREKGIGDTTEVCLGRVYGLEPFSAIGPDSCRFLWIFLRI